MNESSRLSEALSLKFHTINETYPQTDGNSAEDAFAVVYSNTALNWIMAMIYVLGLASCAGLAYVSWFERTGQTGPFRTLLNQLFTHNLEQVILIKIKVSRC